VPLIRVGSGFEPFANQIEDEQTRDFKFKFDLLIRQVSEDLRVE
jgi:hypothetical protein